MPCGFCEINEIYYVEQEIVKLDKGGFGRKTCAISFSRVIFPRLIGAQIFVEVDISMPGL